MRNPFRSEAEAYRFVLGTVVYFAAIVIATAVGGRWWGLGVFLVISAAVLGWFFRREVREHLPAEAPRRRAAEDEQRILVVANETVVGRALRDEVVSRAREGDAEVLVVSPALNSRLRHWTSDEDEARAAAQDRLDESLSALAADEVEARGRVGDDDPIQAIEDSLRVFGADEIVISTHPPGRSNWLERGVVERAGEKFDLPIVHVVVDLEREAETRRSA